MKPIEITLNLSNIDKNRIKERTYENKEGIPVTVKEYKITVVPTKEKKFITKGDGWQLLKTHFVVEKRGKDEPKNYVGEGFTFEQVSGGAMNIQTETPEETGEIPF